MGSNLKEENVAVHLNLRECRLFYVGTMGEVLKLLAEIGKVMKSK